MKKNIKKAGVDEVGRGCLAGPVFSAAVILNSNINTKNIKDSKKIPFKKRILLSKYIKKNSIYAIGTASVKEKESALKRTTQKLENATEDLDKANEEIEQLKKAKAPPKEKDPVKE